MPEKPKESDEVDESKFDEFMGNDAGAILLVSVQKLSTHILALLCRGLGEAKLKALDTYRAMLKALGWCAGALAVGFGEYDQDDREADRIWDEIDDHMDQRRRAQREKLLKAQLEEMRKRNPKIAETFADLKRDLRESMTQADWEVCPVAECTPCPPRSGCA